MDEIYVQIEYKDATIGKTIYKDNPDYNNGSSYAEQTMGKKIQIIVVDLTKEIEDIKNSVRNETYKEGYIDGDLEGYESGYEDGYLDGYKDGESGVNK
jgi:flagellar biosynthesis/type III secretory pathway protein FliH